MNEASSSRSSLDSASACPTTEQSQPNIYPIFKKAKKNHNKSRVLDAPVVPTSTNQSGSASGSGSKKRQRQAEKSPSPELDPAAWDEFVDRWGTRKHDQDNYESDDAPFEAEWKVNKKELKRTLELSDESSTRSFDLTPPQHSDDDDDEEMVAEERIQNVGQASRSKYYKFFIPSTSGATSYQCRLCLRVYKSTSTSNLSKHLIGDVQHKPCTNHHTSLAKLGFPAPPVHATHTKSHTTSLVKKNKSRSKEFDPKVFADMVVIWLLREGLPLALSECPYLAALWYYVNPLAVMHSEPVARMRAKELYEELRPARHHQLMPNLGTAKFGLLINVWTNKFSNYSFHAAMISFIDEDWKFQTYTLIETQYKGVRLAVPLIAYLNHHNLGHKIEAGLESTKHDIPTYDTADDHIISVDHTIARLAAVLHQHLAIPVQTEGTYLHFARPAFKLRTETIEEEEKLQSEYDAAEQKCLEGIAQGVSTNSNQIRLNAKIRDVTHFDAMEEEEEDPIERDEILLDENHVQTDNKKLIEFSRLTMQCPQRRAEFKKLTGGKLLIRLQGMRWDSQHQLRVRAYELKESILEMIKNGNDDGYYSECKISVEGFERINALNSVTALLMAMTERVQKIGPTLSTLLNTLRSIGYDLEQKYEQLHEQHQALGAAIQSMITELKVHFEVAINTKAVVIATFCNPTFRLTFIKHAYSRHYQRVREIIESVYEEYSEPVIEPGMSEDTPPRTDGCTFDDGELQLYEERRDTVGDGQTSLDYWRTHQDVYPVISVIARDYLGLMGSSACTDQLISHAANYPTPKRTMAARATLIKLWLDEGVPLRRRSDFAKAQKESQRIMALPKIDDDEIEY